MTVAERGSRRGVRETDQPGFVDHPDRLDDTLKYRAAKVLPGSADASLTLSDVAPRLCDPQGSQLTETPGSDSTTMCLSEPGIRNTFRSHPPRPIVSPTVR